MNMGTRIKEVRKSLGLTQQEFGDRLGVKRNTIATYEGGRNEPVDAVTSLICRVFNVNEQWLREGEGEMFNSTPSGTMEQLRREYDLDDFDQNLVYEYLKLDRDSRSAVRAFFDRVVAPDPYSGAPQNPEELEALYPPAESGGEVG